MRLSITRLAVPLTVLGVVVALSAVPAEAVLVPPPVAATITSANPVDYTPQVQNGSVRAFTQIGNTIYAGGSFTGIKAAGATAWTPASNLVAYDASTGALKSGFKPVFDNAVQALAVSPDGKPIVGGTSIPCRRPPSPARDFRAFPPHMRRLAPGYNSRHNRATRWTGHPPSTARRQH